MSFEELREFVKEQREVGDPVEIYREGDKLYVKHIQSGLIDQYKLVVTNLTESTLSSWRGLEA